MRIGWHTFSITASKQMLLCSVQEENYKLWPDNKSDSSWQSLSNPATHAMLQQPGFGALNEF